ncbi:MAG: hypothetical protein ACODAE_07020 [Gemmatimonadota bacterium]
MNTNADATRETFDWTGFRLSWGAIVAGLLVATAVQIILTLLGVAIGFGEVQFGPGADFGEFGTGAGIWAIVSALVSLFVGGLTAGHLAGILTRMDGVLHGVLVWGLSLVLTLWAVGAGVGTVLGGVFGAAGQTLAAAVGGVTELGAAVVETGDGIPQFAQPENREQLVDMLQRETNLTPAQTEQAADAIIEGRQQFQLGAEQIQRQAPAAAEEAAGAISTAAWWALLAAILSLAAAAGGAALTAEE